MKLPRIWLTLAAVGAFAFSTHAAGDSVVVINEIHYNPATNSALEYVELRNQLYVNVDMSGWRFDGGITFDFPEGTVIPARGYLVVAKDPAALQAATGFAGALGPFAGNLANDGEKLTLYNNGPALRTRPGSSTLPPANELWSVDIQGNGAGGAFGQVVPTLMSGVEPTSGLGNVWNALTIAGHNGTTANPSLAALVDSAGATSGVGFAITGTVTGFSYTPGSALTYDYLFLNAGNSAASITWRLTGLNPAKTYGLWIYGSFTRSIRVKADANGNGLLTDDTVVLASGGGVLLSGLRPDATGKIIGNADTASGEADWSGFQLYAEQTAGATFDPGTFSASLDRRRIMEEVSYGDSGEWPVAPDGSGFSLAKKDPQTTGANAANWAWSLQRNGTPGAANFPAGAAWNAALPALAFNEISGATDAPFRVEFYNYGASTITLTGCTVIGSEHAATPYTFPASTIAAGGYLALDAATLGFAPVNNERLFLMQSGATGSLIDAVRVSGSARARLSPGAGDWQRPSAATFGAANTFAIPGDVVINEIFYRAFDNGPEEWVEIFNKGAAAVNLTGWKFSAGVDYSFAPGTTLAAGAYLVIARDPASLLAKWPGRPIAGPFNGALSGGDRIQLDDANGNTADEVFYRDGGRWPERAAQGGSSLELRDARADNSVAEAWAPSATQQLGAWQTITYTGVATDDSYGNDAFRDFLLGLLENGEVLIDDVSVRENPTGANIEFIQNGTFESDALGAVPLKWRCLGNHGQGRSVVVADPDNAANKCFRVFATGNTEDKSNRIETTFFTGRQVTVGNTYRISFRARWMGGSNQVNTRLYFNYLQRTTLLNVGTAWGTPGAVNSTATANIGPTATALSHSPVRPAASAAITVSAALSDPDGIASALLFRRVGSGAWTSGAMTPGADGRCSASIPGQAAGVLVQFYVQATDGAGAVSTFPAAGAKGGAFFRVNDGTADASGLRGNVRALISPEDETLLFTSTNRMSNDYVRGTVIDDESTVYYDVGVRLKGSAFGRYAASEFGYSLDFQPDQLFRGVHDSISIERAGSLKEIVANQIINRAGGGYWSVYDDVVKVNGPGASGVALIAASRTGGVFLDGLFPGYGSPTVFNHELLYQPNGTTDGQPESLKLNNPYNHTRGALDLADRGADKEAYRWGFQIRSQRRTDDYSTVVRLNRAFALSGTAFQNEIDATIDVDQWMRTWALMGLYGNDDQYGRLFEHNWRMLPRPSDSRLLALPWDLDRSFNLGTTTQLTPTGMNITRLFSIPAFKRAFDSHVLDLVNSTFNSTYMTPWTTHLSTVTGQDFSSLAGYVNSRSAFALTQLPASVPFAITTNGGADFTTAANTATLTGTGWVDVYRIERAGQAAPLALTWSGANTWSVSVPLTAGANAITLNARDQRNTLTGTDSITITSNTANVAASAANIVISEFHYHPLDPTTSEVAAGIRDGDDFQFVELQNISLQNVELAGAQFTQGIAFAFTASTVVPPGGSVVIVRNPTAFSMRSAAPVAGVFTGTLAHGGETLTLQNATAGVIKSFAYADTDPWPVSADGEGYSLILQRPQLNPDHGLALNWSSSATIGGKPGARDTITYDGWLAQNPALTEIDPLDDPDRDLSKNLAEYAQRTNPLSGTSAALQPRASIEPISVSGLSANYFVLRFRRQIGASDLTFTPSFSSELFIWQSAGLVHLGSVNNGDGTETVTYRSAAPASSRAFGQLQITLDL